ncbi:MAG TPA: hypothetical protein VFG29_01900 [Syntrophales bacterium]|nr:hypothetical protein [Syntrophales bacterium]
MTLLKYDFAEFVERIKDLPYREMLRTTQQTLVQAENQSHGSKGAIRARQRGSLAFADAVGEFLFFLRVGSKPANVGELYWPLYRKPVENLVRKGEMLPSVLSLFEDTDSPHSEEKP